MWNAVRAEAFPAHRGGGPKSFTVGFAGSLKPWHGVEILIDAIGAVASVIPDLRFEVVGDGPLAGVLDRVEMPPDQCVVLADDGFRPRPLARSFADE